MRRITPVSLLLVLSVGAAQAAPIVVGTYAYPGRDRAAAVRPLADFVAATVQRPVEVRIWPSPSALADGLRAGEADVVVPNLPAYLQARAGAVTLPVPDVPPSQAARYRSVIVGRGINGIAALTPQRAASLRLALVGSDSASGGFVPLARLREAGLEEASFAAVVHAGSHEAARLALQQGQVDVAALAADPLGPSPGATRRGNLRTPRRGCRRGNRPRFAWGDRRAARRGCGFPGGAHDPDPNGGEATLHHGPRGCRGRGRGGRIEARGEGLKWRSPRIRQSTGSGVSSS